MGKLKTAVKNLGQAINKTQPEGETLKEIMISFGNTLTGKEITGDTLTAIVQSIADNYEPSPVIDDHSVDIPAGDEIVGTVWQSGNTEVVGHTLEI